MTSLNITSMKISTSLKLLFLAVIIFINKPLMATTIRVNNNLTTDKANRIYSNLQDANDDVATKAGDTLLVDGSVKAYSILKCNKKLVIIGTGYFLTQNLGQSNSVSSTVGEIDFNSGSEGTVITGLIFSYSPNTSKPYISVSGISIIRCYLTNGLYIYNTINSLVLLQNYFDNNSISIINSFSFNGIILKNNVFNSSLIIDRFTNYPRIFTNVEHNIFLGSVQIDVGSFKSNILASNTATVDILSPSIQNNITLGTQLSAYATNQSYKDNTQLFVGLTAANNKSPDGQYKLIAGNAFATAGYNNEEPGIFGGTEPYVLSGIPTIPTIYELQADAVANKQDGLNVTIKARANP